MATPNQTVNALWAMVREHTGDILDKIKDIFRQVQAVAADVQSDAAKEKEELWR